MKDRQAKFNSMMAWARKSGAKFIHPADNPFLFDDNFEQLVENEKRQHEANEKQAKERDKQAKRDQKQADKRRGRYRRF